MNNIKTYIQYNEGRLISKKHDNVAKKILKYINKYDVDYNFSMTLNGYYFHIDSSKIKRLDDPYNEEDWGTERINMSIKKGNGMLSTFYILSIEYEEMEVSNYLAKKIYRSFENMDNIKKERKRNAEANKALDLLNKIN